MDKHRKKRLSSKKIRIGIIGCGAVAQILYKQALIRMKDQIELVSLVDINRPNVDNFLSEFPRAKYFSEISKFLESDLPDAVIVALPHTLHAPTVISCLQKGLHVLCEKPMATSVGDARNMIRAAKKARKILQIGYFRRFFRATQAIKQVIDCGVLGRVRRFEFIEGENYSWPATSDSFFSYKSSGGGVLIDAGAHTTDLMLWWFGDFKYVDYFDDGALTGVESDLIANIKMKSGVTGRLRMSRTAPLANKYKIEFEKGWIVWKCDDVNHFEMGTTGNGIPMDVNLVHDKEPLITTQEGRTEFPPEFRDYFLMQLEHFISSVRENGSPLVDGKEGLRSLSFIEECYKKRKPMSMPWRDIKRETLFMSNVAKKLTKKKIKKLAVVGAAGFIGQRLVEYLSHLAPDKFEVTPIVHRLSSGARLQSQGIGLIQGDVLDEKSILQSAKADVVFCTFVGGTEVIVRGTRNVLEAALRNRVRKVIYLSTQMVYGFTTVGKLSEDVPPPIKKIGWYTYSYDKAQAEKIIKTYRVRGLDITLLRPGIVYGPFSRYWTQNLIENILMGNMFLVGGGSGSCDTVFVDDLIEAMLMCAVDGRSRNASYNISDGERTTWRKFIETYCKYCCFLFGGVRRISKSEAARILKENETWNFKKVLEEIYANGTAVAAIIQTLPLGDVLLKIAIKLATVNQKFQMRGRININEVLDKELFYLQLGKRFLPSSRIHGSIHWKRRHKLSEGIKKSVLWYKTLS